MLRVEWTAAAAAAGGIKQNVGLWLGMANAMAGRRARSQAASVQFLGGFD